MTRKAPFILKNLSIDKMPGFPKGLDGFGTLAPGINVIAGPNASGKSSSARIIQQLIWRKKTTGLQAEASVSVAGEPWELKIDSGKIIVQHDGHDEDLNVLLPPAESSSRYMLALPELVTENEEDLARQIVRESIGGYDLDEAQKNLGYSPLARKKIIRQYQDYETADATFKSIREEHHHLKDEERRLDELRELRKSAEESRDLADLFRKVAEYHEAHSGLGTKAAALEIFPPGIEKASGDEYTIIRNLKEETEQMAREMEEAGASIRVNEVSLGRLKIPGEGISDEILDELEKRITTLAELERRIHDQEEKTRNVRTRENEALKSLGGGVVPEGWEGLDPGEVSGLDAFLQSALQVHSQKQQWETRIGELEKDLAGEPALPPDVVSENIKTLARWLQENKDQRKQQPSWLVPAMIIITVLTGLLALFAGWYWVAGPVAALIAVWIASRPEKDGKAVIRENDFRNSGLREPVSWSIEGVTRRLEELVAELDRAKMKERVTAAITEYRKQLDDLAPKLEGLEKERGKWRQKLRAIPDDYPGMYWFLIQAAEWTERHREAEGLVSARRALDEQYADELRRVNVLLVETNVAAVNDATGARSAFKQLEKEEKTRRDLVKENERLVRENRAREEQLRRNRLNCNAVYEKLGIAGGDERAVLDLVEKLGDYKAARKVYDQAQGTFEDRRRKLEEHPLYNRYASDIEEMSPPRAKEKLDLYEREASGLTTIEKDITEIETRVGDHRKGHNLEDAITARESALDSLAGLYEENLSSVTGHLIVDRLRKVTTEQNRPAVFRKASVLLGRITRGRYELRLEEKGEPAFRAFDTRDRIGLTLGELSTGTRIQLLLAVRLAFIETQEPALRLPILADELLANSDDIRAAAIMEALTGISREGRQIFYFTAQDDEVARWKKHLQGEPDVEFNVIRLEGNASPSSRESPIPPVPAFIHEVPDPGDAGHAGYGRILHIPPFDILTSEPSALHLWYLVEDTRLLHRMLTMGISCYGQVESLSSRGEPIRELTPDALRDMNEKVTILARYLELIRTGRSKPIDRQILEDSGAVSANYIDEVTRLLDEVSHDPQALIQRLRDGGVAGFRQNKTDKLEGYLLQEEFIDSRPVMDPADIALLLNTFIAGHGYDPASAERFLKRLVEKHVNE